MEEKMELKKELEYKDCMSCSEHFMAISYCEDCLEFICVKCVEAHQRLKITKQHKIKSVLKCMSCTDETLASAYCVDCSEFICVNCVDAHKRLNFTREHSIKSIEDELKIRDSTSKGLDFESLSKVNELTKNCQSNESDLANSSPVEDISNNIKDYRSNELDFGNISKVEELSENVSAKDCQSGRNKEVSRGNLSKNPMSRRNITKNDPAKQAFIKRTLNSDENQALKLSKKTVAAIKQFSEDFYTKNEQMLNKAHLIDLESGKLICILCSIKLTPQYREKTNCKGKVLALQWNARNYNRHLTLMHQNDKDVLLAEMAVNELITIPQLGPVEGTKNINIGDVLTIPTFTKLLNEPLMLDSKAILESDIKEQQISIVLPMDSAIKLPAEPEILQLIDKEKEQQMAADHKLASNEQLPTDLSLKLPSQLEMVQLLDWQQFNSWLDVDHSMVVDEQLVVDEQMVTDQPPVAYEIGDVITMPTFTKLLNESIMLHSDIVSSVTEIGELPTETEVVPMIDKEKDQELPTDQQPTDLSMVVDEQLVVDAQLATNEQVAIDLSSKVRNKPKIIQSINKKQLAVDQPPVHVITMPVFSKLLNESIMLNSGVVSKTEIGELPMDFSSKLPTDDDQQPILMDEGESETRSEDQPPIVVEGTKLSNEPLMLDAEAISESDIKEQQVSVVVPIAEVVQLIDNEKKQEMATDHEQQLNDHAQKRDIDEQFLRCQQLQPDFTSKLSHQPEMLNLMDNNQLAVDEKQAVDQQQDADQPMVVDQPMIIDQQMQIDQQMLIDEGNDAPSNMIDDNVPGFNGFNESDIPSKRNLNRSCRPVKQNAKIKKNLGRQKNHKYSTRSVGPLNHP